MTDPNNGVPNQPSVHAVPQGAASLCTAADPPRACPPKAVGESVHARGGGGHIRRLPTAAAADQPEQPVLDHGGDVLPGPPPRWRTSQSKSER
ncbi:MAG: hypothetical protein JWO48_3844 [Bryobacterales bacterium]|nr:hypothetical protein [Bryobacterales bacterium]